MFLVQHSGRITAGAAIVALLLSGAPAAAGPRVVTASAVFVERGETDRTRRLEPAQRLNRGDRIVTLLSWRRESGSGSFIITNPLPASLAYQSSADDSQEVSVDGGRTWGKLGMLRIGSRLATPEDVTHIRWRIAASRAASGRGQIAYSGIVR